MKKIFRQIKRRKIAMALLFFAFFLFTMCITILEINQPTSAEVGERITITLDLKVAPSTDDEQHLILGFLAPVSWSVADNATVTYTSSAGNGTMSLAPDDEQATNTTEMLNWKDEMTAVFGLGENYGKVKWIAFKSDTKLTATKDVEITGHVQLEVTVGSRNLKTQLGYVLANTGYGVRDTYHDAQFTDCMEITGGTNSMDDLCGSAPSSVIFQPETFALEDIIKINFNADGSDTSLVGVDQVYLCLSANIEGRTVNMCDTSNENLKMNKMEANLWSITIWPKGLFNVSNVGDMSDVSFSFQNEAGDIMVKDPNSGSDFLLEQNCN